MRWCGFRDSVHASDEGFGVEGFEIGHHVGELAAELAGEILRERLGLLDLELADRSRLAEQENLAAAHAEQLAGDALGGPRAKRCHQAGDVVRADLERALLVGPL